MTQVYFYRCIFCCEFYRFLVLFLLENGKSEVSQVMGHTLKTPHFNIT